MSQIIKQIKPVFEEVLSPVINLLYKSGISPNSLTILGFSLIILASVFIVQGKFIIGGLLLIAGNICDFLDGALARKFNKTTSFGAFLDSVIDRLSDFLPVMSLGIYFRDDLLFLFLTFYTIGISFMVSYTRARAEGLGIDCKIGIMERAERSIVLIISILTGFALHGLIIISAGATITTLQRVFCVYKKTN